MYRDNVNYSLSMPAFYEWRIAGLCILCIRFVQGWIFWGGGSRRFFYAPQKLNPYATQWMANKLQSAMPGALLGVGDVISFLLQHFYLLYAAIIVFSLVELLSGAALIAGIFTRAAGFVTVLLSIALMVIFGWEGGTCIDEWTMSVANLSIGLTLALSGGSIYSIDSWLLRRYPALADKAWFITFASGPWSYKTLKRTGILFFVFTVFFTLSTYNYYRGAIFSRYHPGPVSPVEYHVNLSDGVLSPDGAVTFTAYVDAGAPSQPCHIIRAELLNPDGTIIELWSGKQLSALPQNNIVNVYAYNRIKTGIYGIEAPVSAKANITLVPEIKFLNMVPGQYQLRLYSIDGKRWELTLRNSQIIHREIVY